MKKKKMIKTSKFQVVLPTEVLEKSYNKALGLGFNSVQDMVRVFLVSVTKNNIDLSFKEDPLSEKISPEYEAFLNKRLEETLKAIEDGTAYSANSGEELIKILDSDD